MQPNYVYISFFYGIWVRGRFSLNDTHSLSRYAFRNVAPVYAGDSVLVSPRQSNHPVESSYRLSPSLPVPFEASFVRRPVSFLALLFPPSHRSLASACSVISTIRKFNLSGFEQRWLRRITIQEKWLAYEILSVVDEVFAIEELRRYRLRLSNDENVVGEAGQQQCQQTQARPFRAGPSRHSLDPLYRWKESRSRLTKSIEENGGAFAVVSKPIGNSTSRVANTLEERIDRTKSVGCTETDWVLVWNKIKNWILIEV